MKESIWYFTIVQHIWKPLHIESEIYIIINSQKSECFTNQYFLKKSHASLDSKHLWRILGICNDALPLITPSFTFPQCSWNESHRQIFLVMLLVISTRGNQQHEQQQAMKAPQRWTVRRVLPSFHAPWQVSCQDPSTGDN